ncbi:hypothetical protein WN72_09835 [Bradyrhizobium arachidis]|uniref:Uncharacterized protein n=1 Tax=Bradyrhizobium arachidis TaxID=858423 RepID=A0AAE7NM14_9BRAD|nr:hypothetical protein WN72_09835 [Bradyrhizobium arachidis]
MVPLCLQSHPLALGPDRNHQLIAFPGRGGGTLKPYAFRALQMTRMIGPQPRARSGRQRAFECLALAGRVRCRDTPIQEPTQTGSSLFARNVVPAIGGIVVAAAGAVAAFALNAVLTLPPISPFSF